MKINWLSVWILLLLISIISCKKELEEPDCPPPLGEMIAHVNDTLIWEFNHTYFINPVDSTTMISADFINAGCELELSLVFRNILMKSDTQNLVQRIYGNDEPSEYLPHSIFYTWNIDALTERFNLYEKEPAWIYPTEISDELITGVFQATYVYRPSAQRFWALPDTLRFNNVQFEADLFNPDEE